MENIFKILTKEELQNQSGSTPKPRAISPYAPLNTGVYRNCKVLKVFLRKSAKSDAHFVDITFRIELENGQSVDKPLTLLVTNSQGSSVTQTGSYLKGFNLLNSLSLLATDKQIAELAPQQCVELVYGQQTVGQCFPQLENAVVALLLLKYREPRQVVKDPKYPYREDNEIYQILDNESGYTYEEKLGKVDTPKTLDYFSTTYKSDFVQERLGGKPRPTNKAPSAPTNGLPSL